MALKKSWLKMPSQERMDENCARPTGRQTRWRKIIMSWNLEQCKELADWCKRREIRADIKGWEVLQEDKPDLIQKEKNCKIDSKE